MEWYVRNYREYWKPSIHMPKEAARIWLKTTGLRMERLQDITDDGAEKEGCSDCTSTAMGFFDVWDLTIKKADRPRYGWEANPWVWVIEFERCGKQETDRFVDYLDKSIEQEDSIGEEQEAGENENIFQDFNRAV